MDLRLVVVDDDAGIRRAAVAVTRLHGSSGGRVHVQRHERGRLLASSRSTRCVSWSRRRRRRREGNFVLQQEISHDVIKMIIVLYVLV
jgi:hypothetical protein